MIGARHVFYAALPALLLGCAASRAPEIDDAVQDFIAVSELTEHEKIRTRGGYRYDELGERYVIITTVKHQYLVQFTRRCRELYEAAITPDLRREANVLRAGYDTLRGCRIDRIYAVEEAQAQELMAIGERPGAES